MIEITFNPSTCLSQELYNNNWQVSITSYGIELKEKYSKDLHCYPWASIARIKRYED